MGFLTDLDFKFLLAVDFPFPWMIKHSREQNRPFLLCTGQLEKYFGRLAFLLCFWAPKPQIFAILKKYEWHLSCELRDKCNVNYFQILL